MNLTTSRTARAEQPATVDAAIEARPRITCHGKNGIACEATIFWGRTAEHGRPIPLDYDPAPSGNLVIVAVGPDPNRGEEETAFWIGPYAPLEDQDGTELRFVSHFVSCPAASEFRKPKHGSGKRGRR